MATYTEETMRKLKEVVSDLGLHADSALVIHWQDDTLDVTEYAGRGTYAVYRFTPAPVEE